MHTKETHKLAQRNHTKDAGHFAVAAKKAYKILALKMM